MVPAPCRPPAPYKLTLAARLMYEGMVEEGVELVRHIRERHDGKKRNPYDEAEYGHHDARAMVARADASGA